MIIGACTGSAISIVGWIVNLRICTFQWHLRHRTVSVE